MALETKLPATTPGQTPPGSGGETPKVDPPVLPSELSQLGFKDVKDVVDIVARYGEAVEDAGKAKAMLREMTKGGDKVEIDPLTEITDDSFMQSPKQATVKTIEAILNKQFRERVDPLAGQLIEGNLLVQKQVLKADKSMGPLLEEYEKEVDEFLRGVPPSMKVQPGCVSTALQYVLGKNIDKVMTKVRSAASAPPPGAGSEGGSAGSGAPLLGGPKPRLAPDEEAAALKQVKAGMFKSLDEYVEWRDKE